MIGALTYSIARAGEVDKDDASVIVSRSQVPAVLLKKPMMWSNVMISAIKNWYGTLLAVVLEYQ